MFPVGTSGGVHVIKASQSKSRWMQSIPERDATYDIRDVLSLMTPGVTLGCTIGR